MYKRFLGFLIIVLCLQYAFAFAETPTKATETTIPDAVQGQILLPSGGWELQADGSWVFITESPVQFMEAQMSIASEAQIPLSGDMLPIGTALTARQLSLLYPGAESVFGVPDTEAALAPFSLTGEWYYEDDCKLYYRHNKASAPMTMEEVFAVLNGEPPLASSEKIIYLTIDDSPSKYTMEFLAALEKAKVKATFFVVGAYVKARPVFLRAIYEQGHVIANHSYTHNARILKSSYPTCLNDFKRCENEVAKALGFPLKMPIIRIPYGVSTIPEEYRAKLQQAGYLWIDWNALNGDTESNSHSDQDVLDRAISTASRYDGSIVMLVHDGKKRTIRTLPLLVEHFRAEGYEFRVLDIGIPKITGVRSGLPIQEEAHGSTEEIPSH